MAFGTFTRDLPLKKIGFNRPFQPPMQQPQAQAGLPLVIQQLYGGVPFTPGADTMEGGFRTSPGFRPGAPMNINMPAVAPTRPGFIDFMPKIPGVPFGAQTTLSDLVAFNPAASQYALAGFTVGEILAMPEFADFAQFQAQQTGGTATSAGLAALEAQLQQLGAKGGPEDRPEGFGPKTRFQPTTMKFLDNKLVYDKINPAINQQILGIAEDQPVPGIPSLFSALTTLGTSLFDKVTDPFTKYREKKAEEERQARIAEEKAALLALREETKKIEEERKRKREAKELEEKRKKARALKESIDRNRAASEAASGFSSDTTAPGADASTIGGTGGRRGGAGPGRGGGFGGDNTGGRDAGPSGGTGGRRGGAGPF